MITRLLTSAHYRKNKFLVKHLGWKTKRKIVVIESDDWGSIRMPSSEVLETLLSGGVRLNPNGGYDRYDTLASVDDLSYLFEVLNSVRDKNNKPAVITFNSVMANPDFNKIQESNFTKYFYEPFQKTLSKKSATAQSFEVWLQGMQIGVMQPQFHAREHLNAQLWLQGLKNNYSNSLAAFKKGVFSNSFDKNLDVRGRYLEAYNVAKESEYSFTLEALNEGLDMFEKTFGFKSSTMIAPNYLWDERVEEQAAKKGVVSLQGVSTQRLSQAWYQATGKKLKGNYTGKLNSFGQIYTVRNCFYEPSSSKNQTEFSCLNEIERAFKGNQPAIISSHRVNFIGGLSKTNRDTGLQGLQVILNEITKKYADVEFMSSDQLTNLILESKK